MSFHYWFGSDKAQISFTYGEKMSIPIQTLNEGIIGLGYKLR